MELYFADPSLQRIVESVVRSAAHFGARDGALLRQRLCELVAADNLAIAGSVPALDLRPLASHTGGFAIRLRPRLRLVFEIAEPVPQVAGNGEVDPAKVGMIRILAIEKCDEP